MQAVAEGQHLIAIGAERASGEVAVSFGKMQDEVLCSMTTDVLLTICSEPALPTLRRILVPINGLAHSLAAADVAAYIAKGSDAEIVLLTVVAPRLGSLFWRERRHRDLLQAGYTITREAQRRVGRLGVKLSEQVVLAPTPGDAVLKELQRQSYDLLVLGGVTRSSPQGVSLGRTVEHLLQTASLSKVLLVSRAVDTAAA